MNKKKARAGHPAIEYPPHFPAPPARYVRKWRGVKKVDSKRSTPMKVGGTLVGAAPGRGKRARNGRGGR